VAGPPRATRPGFARPVSMRSPNMRRFTTKQLEQGRGKDGAPALVACRGIVYDVSHSYHWRNGRHHALHSAGEDLTASLDRAPHGMELLERVPAAGVLVDE